MNLFLTHAPALCIALPFLMAALIFALPSRVASALSFATTTAVTALAVSYVLTTNGARPLIYAFGGFSPPAGISFLIDDFNIIPLVLIAIIGLIGTLQGLGDGASEVNERRQSNAAALVQVLIGALLGMVLSGDAFNIFMFMEVAAISACALIALSGERDRRGFTAAFEFMMFSAVGSGLYLLGIGFLYLASGSLNLGDMMMRLTAEPAPQLEAAGFALVFAGLAAKAALFPLHGWLPRVVKTSPSFVVMLLAGAGAVAFVTVLLRFWVFTDAKSGIATILTTVGAPLAAAAILWGGLRAIYAKESREMLSFSAIAEVGYIVLALSIGTHAALTAIMITLIADALAKVTAFAAVGAVERLTGGSGLDAFRGGFSRQPLVATSLALALACTLGAPLTLGFTAKWLLADAAIENEAAWIAVVMVLGSVMPAIYGGRLLERLFFRPGLPASSGKRSSPWSVTPMIMVAFALVALGSASGSLVNVAQAAATELLKVGGPR